MNKELLFQLYAIHSPSGREKKMRKFVRRQALLCGAQSIETDVHGNVLITKGHADTYPCLAAHLDQVQFDHSKDFKVVECGDDVFGYSPRNHEQQGLGADDKNGIFICLECLRKYDAVKVAFFVGEETGCVGSSAVDLGFFADCRFIIEPDRRGGSDLITSMYCGRCCSDDFIGAIGADLFGYREERGSITDVGTLVERGVGISCLNLSCGYYHAHTDHEVTVLSELENCLNFVQHIVENVTDVYPFEYQNPFVGGRYGYGGGGYGYGYGGSYGDVWDEGYVSQSVSDDYDLMHEILESEPNISFDELWLDWSSEFFTTERKDLQSIYEYVKSYFTNGDDFWDDGDAVLYYKAS